MVVKTNFAQIHPFRVLFHPSFNSLLFLSSPAILFNLVILLDLVRYNIAPLLVILILIPSLESLQYSPWLLLSGFLSCFSYSCSELEFFVLWDVKGRMPHSSNLFHCSRPCQAPWCLHIILYIRCSPWAVSGFLCSL